MRLIPITICIIFATTKIILCESHVLRHDRSSESKKGCGLDFVRKHQRERRTRAIGDANQRRVLMSPHFKTDHRSDFEVYSCLQQGYNNGHWNWGRYSECYVKEVSSYEKLNSRLSRRVLSLGSTALHCTWNSVYEKLNSRFALKHRCTMRTWVNSKFYPWSNFDCDRARFLWQTDLSSSAMQRWTNSLNRVVSIIRIIQKLKSWMLVHRW